MAEPARVGADEPGLAGARRPDPRASGWPGAQRAMIAAAELNILAVAGALARPAAPDALEIARLSIAVLESLGDTLRRLSFDAAVMAEERQRGFDEGYEACKAQRCRLEVIPGGHA